MSPNPYIAALKNKNFRISKTREAVISFFCSHEKPLTAMEIMDLLAEKGNEVNKTTVYRELDFLESEHIIKKVQIDSTTEYYELADREHHHHLVCTDCKKILDFSPSDAVEKEIKSLIADVENRTGFRVQEHSFELYGRCEECKC